MTQREQYNSYMKSRIMTASPAELILLLYDGAIKFCNIAIMGIEEDDIEKAHNNIRKVERIVDELTNSLDEKYEVAKDFANVYHYMKQRLIQANVSKDKEILEEVLKHLRTMRDTWKEVMRLNVTQPEPMKMAQ